VVILASYKSAKKRLFVYEDNKLTEMKNLDPNMMIIKVRLIDKNRVLLGLLSNELILYDIEKNEQIYRTVLSESSFADVALTKDKKEAAVGCESGKVFLVDTDSGQLKSIIKGANRDKSYKVDIKNGLVLSAGQDSIGAIYNLSSKTFKTLKASFLIYAGALSPDGSRAVYAFNENNELIVVDATGNDTTAYLLSGQKSTLNAIVFRDNNTLVSASDDEYIMLWKIP
jgi:WD40 repeat protein